jgi:WD40 repeat protein
MRMASSREDNAIVVWDAASGKQVGQPLVGHQGRVTSIAFGPDGETLASGSCGELDLDEFCIQGEIRLWDVASGLLLGDAPLVGHTGEVRDVAFSPDEDSL